MTQKTSKAPTHEIFHVVGDGDTSRWTKIGIAFEHTDDKGLNLIINYKPLNDDGRMVVRLIEKKGANNEASN